MTPDHLQRLARDLAAAEEGAGSMTSHVEVLQGEGAAVALSRERIGERPYQAALFGVAS